MANSRVITDLYTTYETELSANLPQWETAMQQLRTSAAERYPDIRRTADGDVAGTVTLQDAQLLYLFIRQVKPAVVFEIGTWVGTSALIIAEAMKQNGHGHLYTCDSNSYACLPPAYDQWVTLLHGYSDQVISEIPTEHPIDVIFADGECTWPTLRALTPYYTKDTQFITHDYTRPAEKGVRNILRWQWFTNGHYSLVSNPILPGGGTPSTLAFALSRTLMSNLKGVPQSRTTVLLHLVIRGFTTYTYLIVRKGLRTIIQLVN